MARATKRKPAETPSSDLDEQDTSLAKKIHRARREALLAQTKRADYVLTKATKGKDEIMDRIRVKVETDHPSKLNDIYTNLLKDLEPHDKSIAAAWQELGQIDKDAKEAYKVFFRDIKKAREDLERTRAGCIEVIQKQIEEENKAVETLKKAIEPLEKGMNKSVKGQVVKSKGRKKPRMTDATLVDSE